MKLDTKTIDYIQNVIKVCKLVNIESIIIDSQSVRGMNPEKTQLIIHPHTITLPFKSIGLTRLATLQTRLDAVQDLEGYFIEANEKEGKDFIFSLTLGAKKTKIQYRCADPLRIDAKQKSNDIALYKITLTEQLVDMIKKATSAMSADRITILNNQDGTFFEMADVNNDIFSQEFSQKTEILDEGTEPFFVYKYPIKLLLSAFKDDPNNTFYIGRTGIMQIKISGITTFILPIID